MSLKFLVVFLYMVSVSAFAMDCKNVFSFLKTKQVANISTKISTKTKAVLKSYLTTKELARVLKKAEEYILKRESKFDVHAFEQYIKRVEQHIGKEAIKEKIKNNLKDLIQSSQIISSAFPNLSKASVARVAAARKKSIQELVAQQKYTQTQNLLRNYFDEDEASQILTQHKQYILKTNFDVHKLEQYMEAIQQQRGKKAVQEKIKHHFQLFIQEAARL